MSTKTVPKGIKQRQRQLLAVNVRVPMEPEEYQRYAERIKTVEHIGEYVRTAIVEKLDREGVA